MLLKNLILIQQIKDELIEKLRGIVSKEDKENADHYQEQLENILLIQEHILQKKN